MPRSRTRRSRFSLVAYLRVLFVSSLFPDTSQLYRGLDNASLLHHLSRHCHLRVISPRPALPLVRSAFVHASRPIDTLFVPLYPVIRYVPKLRLPFNHHLCAAAIREPLLRLRHEFAYDVILVSWTFPEMAAIAKLQQKLRVPFVGIVQGSDGHAYLKMPWLKATIINAVNRSFATVTRSVKLADLLTGAGARPDKVHAVYNGVDLELFRPSNKDEARRELGLIAGIPVLLFVGSFVPVKNPLLLIRAHAHFCARYPARRCQLVMVGSGPMEPKMRRTAKREGSGELVIFGGPREAAGIARYMQAADVLCLASENEGVPNVILEAFASGLPVLSTSVGGVPEVVCEDVLGRLVQPGNVEDMVAGIGNLLARANDSEAIRRHALRFSWENASASYLRLLHAAAAAGFNI